VEERQRKAKNTTHLSSEEGPTAVSSSNAMRYLYLSVPFHYETIFQRDFGDRVKVLTSQGLTVGHTRNYAPAGW